MKRKKRSHRVKAVTEVCEHVWRTDWLFRSTTDPRYNCHVCYCVDCFERIDAINIPIEDPYWERDLDETQEA